jgi:hypothetical protein
MPVPKRPGSRDFSKDNIRQLRVERKEITFSGPSLDMERIDTSETKGSSGQPQVQHTVSVGYLQPITSAFVEALQHSCKKR